MPTFPTRHTVMLVAAVAAVLIGGCSADGADPNPADAGTSPVATAEVAPGVSADAAAPEVETEPAADAPGERPEGLDASLPVPPGTLVTATQTSSEWEYIYSDVTSDEARVFAAELEAMGFSVQAAVDSEGVEQWYMQSANWAIKLEETHAEESLMYWVDPISE